MQRLTSKAVEARMPSFDFEAYNLVKSLFLDSSGGAVAVNPSLYAGRYVLK